MSVFIHIFPSSVHLEDLGAMIPHINEHIQCPDLVVLYYSLIKEYGLLGEIEDSRAGEAIYNMNLEHPIVPEKERKCKNEQT